MVKDAPLLAGLYLLLVSAHSGLAQRPRLEDLPAKAFGKKAIVRNVHGDLEATLIEHLGLQPETTLHRRYSDATAHQTKLTRFDMKISGVPVYASVITVESDADESSVYRIYRNDASQAKVQASTLFSGRVSADEAILATASAFNLKRSWIKQYATNKEAQLVWYMVGDSNYQLCYKVSFNFMRPSMDPLRPFAIIDAGSGEILSSWNGISSATTTYTSFTGIGGNNLTGRLTYRNLPAVSLGNNVCLLKSPYWEVRNVYHIETNITDGVWRFPCNGANTVTYDYYNGCYSPSNDVAYAMNVTVNMMFALIGEGPLLRDVLTNNSLIALVHFGRNYNNAFFNGWYIYVGDGDGVNYYPFTALDVIAHEIGHAYTQSHSMLQTNDMPGAVNEAYSDITGTMAKYFQTRTRDFLWGKNVQTNGRALRDLCNPTSLGGTAIKNVTHWKNTTDVHDAAGIFNQAFCIMTSYSDWGMNLTYLVWTWANKHYWYATCTFMTCACGVFYAAIDLVGFEMAYAVPAAFESSDMYLEC